MVLHPPHPRSGFLSGSTRIRLGVPLIPSGCTPCPPKPCRPDFLSEAVHAAHPCLLGQAFSVRVYVTYPARLSQYSFTPCSVVPCASYFLSSILHSAHPSPSVVAFSDLLIQSGYLSNNNVHPFHFSFLLCVSSTTHLLWPMLSLSCFTASSLFLTLIHYPFCL